MTITLFFVSMLVVSLMLTSKFFEVRIRRIHFVAKVLNACDDGIHKLIDLSILKYNRYKKISNIFVFEFLPSVIYEMLIKMKDYVSKKYYSAGDKINGKRVLRSNGSVSFFLERLSEDKSNAEAPKV